MIYYKYLTPERIDVLENFKIRFTQVSAFNDPFESLPAIIQKNKEWYWSRFKQIVNDEIRELGITRESKKIHYFRGRKKDFPNWHWCYSDENWLKKLSEQVQTISAGTTGCLSLSATEKNILIWSHYSQNHEGFVIGFDGNHEYFGQKVHKIRYSDTRPYHDPTRSSNSAEIFHTKSKDWEYEQEYRKCEALTEGFTLENGNMFSPYSDENKENTDKNKIFLFDYPKDSISSIILGWKSNECLKKSILEIIKNHNLKGVQLLRASPHKFKYEMEITKEN